jgi:hypothetical protein
MWNFTAQAVLIPNTDDIKEVLNKKESCLSPQGSATDMKPEDIFLESNDEKVSIFSKAVDQYLLDVLDISLNKVPLTAKEVKEIDEMQINSHLKTLTESQINTAKYDINVPTYEEILIHAMDRSASYHWVGLCPGDLQNKGYFCKAIFKVHGPSGFHHLWCEILKTKATNICGLQEKEVSTKQSDQD